jgi:hypothetical protein
MLPLNDFIQCRGTPGMGDQMMSLNIAHNVAARLNRKVTLEIHWPHDGNSEWLHHYEDPETMEQRTKYIHQLYTDYNQVEVVYKHTCSDELWHNRTSGPDPTNFTAINDWNFDPNVSVATIPNKVVYWTPYQNAELARKWKLEVSPQDWLKIIQLLQFNGFDCHELTYRTSIREATWHINTASFVVCYDGMWHYIARNFHKPMIVTSKANITRSHTPQAMMIDGKNAVDIFNTMMRPIYKGRTLQQHIQFLAKDHRRRLKMAQLKWKGLR